MAVGNPNRGQFWDLLVGTHRWSTMGVVKMTVTSYSKFAYLTGTYGWRKNLKHLVRQQARGGCPCSVCQEFQRRLLQHKQYLIYMLSAELDLSIPPVLSFRFAL